MTDAIWYSFSTARWSKSMASAGQTMRHCWHSAADAAVQAVGGAGQRLFFAELHFHLAEVLDAIVGAYFLFFDGAGRELGLAGQHFFLVDDRQLRGEFDALQGLAAQPAVHVKGGALALADGLDDDGRAQYRFAAGEYPIDAGHQRRSVHFYRLVAVEFDSFFSQMGGQRFLADGHENLICGQYFFRIGLEAGGEFSFGVENSHAADCLHSGQAACFHHDAFGPQGIDDFYPFAQGVPDLFPGGGHLLTLFEAHEPHIAGAQRRAVRATSMATLPPPTTSTLLPARSTFILRLTMARRSMPLITESLSSFSTPVSLGRGRPPKRKQRRSLPFLKGRVM